MSRLRSLAAALLAGVMAFGVLLAPVSAAQDASADPVYDFADIPFSNPSAVATPGVTPSSSAAASPVASSSMHGGLLGDPDAPVTLTIYADYQCPHCRNFHAQIEPLLVEDFVRNGDIRLEFVDFPVIGIGSFENLPDDSLESVQAAEATLCAGEQDAYMLYREALYAGSLDPNSGALSDTNLARIAGQLGLDDEALAECLASGRYEHAVIAGSRRGLEIGVQGTPTMAIGNEILSASSYADLVDLIEEAVNAQ